MRGGRQRAARLARLGGRAALAAGGALVGGVLVGALTASAANNNSNADESRSQRPDERLLTGDTATKVREAALARYPGATVLRVETDSDGVYEAHLTTSDGRRVTVEVDKSFTVTGEEAGRGRP